LRSSVGERTTVNREQLLTENGNTFLRSTFHYMPHVLSGSTLPCKRSLNITNAFGYHAAVEGGPLRNHLLSVANRCVELANHSSEQRDMLSLNKPVGIFIVSRILGSV